MNMGTHCKTIVWFRRDLRIEDNPALAQAARVGCVLPVYIWCPKEEGQFYPGRVSRWWLKQSLVHLDQSLRSLGAPLLLIKTEDTLSALLRCISAIGATQVVYNHLYDPVSLVRDHCVKQKLVEQGIIVQSLNGDLLYEPWEVYDDEGLAFTTFDEYWNKCISMSVEPVCLLPPRRLVPASEKMVGCTIEELGLENEYEKSSNALLSRAWSPGWCHADKALSEFISQRLEDYSMNRLKAEGLGTALLSPYLHFGELSIRKVLHSVRMKQLSWAREGNSDAEESVNLFLRSIGFREYSRYLCFNFPFTHEKSLLGNLKFFPWRTDHSNFKAWRQGRTGYPLVDAGMRELWATGWLHNRIRVVVSSFCVKFLQLPWTWGMKYFWDTLLDADLECDILGWQYISGSLPDGHELDRLDHPEDQGYKFDPEGEYVRQWLPELARMPTEWIHHPWDAPVSVLKAAGVELGLNYPNPIVEIDSAKECLAQSLSKMWELEAASRTAKANGSDENVGDNLNSINEIPNVPRVVIKKKEAPESSSWDQRVPTVQSMHKRNGVNNLVGEDVNRVNLRNQINGGEVLSRNDEMSSTADSSSIRKRSLNESCFNVPSSSLPQSGSWLKGIDIDEVSTSKGEEGFGAHMRPNCLRPCKRPATFDHET
ncbi:cryptochrome-1 isoform X2 [Amborella trichopoda]|nr:cryptochrome-1 isoform X2 [Amborella trichopoda]|eukprot:XP_006846831.2 cryptochrome-1 isoform X2 [Amborella trichopoda]